MVLSRLRLQKGISSGATGHIDFDMGHKPVLLKEINAGWENSVFAHVSLKKYHADLPDHVVYLDGGPSIPTPASPHVSIFVWKGDALLDGRLGYQLRVSGICNHSAADVLHAEVVYEEL